MEKRIKIREIGMVTRMIIKFSPITESTNNVVFNVLISKFENFQRWSETKPITRKKFESHLHQNQDLVDEYLEVFASEAKFYLCTINFKDQDYKYYIMYVGKMIVLLYFLRNDLTTKL